MCMHVCMHVRMYVRIYRLRHSPDRTFFSLSRCRGPAAFFNVPPNVCMYVLHLHIYVCNTEVMYTYAICSSGGRGCSFFFSAHRLLFLFGCPATCPRHPCLHCLHAWIEPPSRFRRCPVCGSLFCGKFFSARPWNWRGKTGAGPHHRGPKMT